MTILIGMYYNNRKGILMASDSRVLNGSDICLKRPKLIKIDNSILSFTGDVFLIDEILEKIKEKSQNEKMKEAIQEAYLEVRAYYTEGKKPLVPKEEFLCSGIFGFFDKNKPKMYNVDDKGFLQSSDGFEVDGQGKEHIEKILGTIYRGNLSKKEAVQTAIYSIIEVSKLNSGVDDSIQIAVMENERGNILNYKKDGEFDFQMPEIVSIRDEMVYASEQEKRLLKTLINGSKEDKSKLEKLLVELENNRH
jgi:20S proteasome alpha/beta subunit